MDKLVITSTEVESVKLIEAAGREEAKPPRPIPLWARLAMLPLVTVLPLLCLIAVILRIALRATAPRTREAWNAYLNTLLVSSGLLSTAGAVLLFSYMPAPPQAISTGLSDLDERISYPALPAAEKMTGTTLAEALKPLVMVASPVQRRWFGKSDMPSGLTGAALLLEASSSGYLFATARHVADGFGWRSAKGTGRVLLSSGGGGWAAANVVARHRDFDVALLWVRRYSGHSSFHQPLAVANEARPGETVYVIGHPQGLNFSIASGIVSRVSNAIVQISAPVSPGNSGGPVYDERGLLVGVVTAKVDRSLDPNAENLNFAVKADVLTSTQGWEFIADGKQLFEAYVSGLTPATSPANNRPTEARDGKH
ncbi:MAG: serine protease [Acidobacteriales bacterium]|nr:serine protease [Terriglobales bacterium]